ncbi:DNA primase [Bacillus wiedmannii]|uniref:DNA primase n=1 Tax=Bacillus wiedmannii TaxID=1890302 RepID=UPI003D1FAC41
MQNDLYRAKEWLVDILDCHHLLSKDKKKRADLLHWLKPIKKKRTRVVDLAEITPNDVLDEEETYKYYDMYPAQWWIDEGLSWETQCEFEVGFDILSERIVFAIRDARGELVGVKGRTVVNDTRKYLYLYPCNKSIELFNLYRATPIIKDIKRVIIFESEKSVMFAHQYGYGECIAICGDELSDVQAQLIKNLGHDIQIIFAMDKDKDAEFVYSQAEKITNREIHAIFDVEGLLEGKEAPVDKGQEVFKKLIEENCFFVRGKEL